MWVAEVVRSADRIPPQRRQARQFPIEGGMHEGTWLVLAAHQLPVSGTQGAAAVLEEPRRIVITKTLPRGW